MQLKIVVFPAPLGPMRPTISNSSTLMETSRNACSPPKRIDTCSVSRTGIDPLRAGPAAHVHAETPAFEPSSDGRRDRAQPLRLEDQREDGEDARHSLDDIAGVGLQPAGKAEASEEVGHGRAAQF